MVVIWLLVHFLAIFVAGDESGVQSWVWETPEIFPSFPIAAPDSVNSKCKNDSLLLIDGLRNRYKWAVRMWDSTPRAPEGILMGTHTFLGNYDSCLKVDTPIKAQFCMALYFIHISPELNDSRTIYPLIRDEGLDKRLAPKDQAFIGMCVPASCSADDMNLAINTHLAGSKEMGRFPNGTSYNIFVINSSCNTIDRMDNISTGEASFWIFVIFIVAVSCLCSLMNCSDDRKSLAHCFSIKRNVSKLFTVKKPDQDDGIYVFHGIKAFAICVVYFTHKAMSAVWVSTSHEFIESNKISPYITFNLIEADLPCDTFFFLSGALVAHSFYRSLHKNMPNPLFLIFNRFLRLVPSYYFSIWLHTVALDRIFTGPTWNLFYGFDVEHCRKNWWLNLLMVQNYIKTDEMCITSSWYVSCDFHYFIVAVLVVLILRRNEKMGLYLIGVLLLLTTASPGITTYFQNLDVLFMHWYSFQMYPRSIAAFRENYVPSHNRAAIYVVGMFYGIYMFKQRGKTTKLNFKGFLFGIFLALCFMCLPSLMGWQFYDKAATDDNLLTGSIFVAIRRPFWGIGIAILLYVFHFYPIRSIKSIFESKIAVVMSRLTYGIYLLHLSLIIARNISRREPTSPDMFFILMDSAADMGLVTIIAANLYIFLDLPIQNLLNFLLRGKKSKTKKLESNSKSASAETVQMPEPEIIEIANNEENITIHCKEEEHKL